MGVRVPQCAAHTIPTMPDAEVYTFTGMLSVTRIGPLIKTCKLALSLGAEVKYSKATNSQQRLLAEAVQGVCDLLGE